MTDYKYPLASDTWGTEERVAISDVLASGNLTYGAKVAEFEEAAAAYFGSNHAVMVNSGSSANLLALAAVLETRGIPRDGTKEVIVTAVSWATTYFPISQLGLRIRLVDIDLESLNAAVSSIEAAISENTVGIFVVNLLGNPSDLTAIRALSDEKGLFFLEDNCESMGAVVDGRQAGTFGDVGTFSTYYSHHISTIEGGFCLTDDLRLYQYMMSMRSHGWTRGLPPKNMVHDATGSFLDAFMFVLPGFNLRPMEIQGAIGIEQLKKLSSFIEVRRRNAENFISQAKEFAGEIQFQKEHGASSWFGFSLVLRDDASIDRRALVELLTSHRIAVRPIVAGNISKHPVASRLNMVLPEGGLPNSDIVHDRGLFVGNHHFDLDDPINRFFEVLSTALKL
ncbi:MAG: pyridoxamine 5-phosphate oxidase [Actinobacteria bacterium]|uniref:Unannotated protein n=1 Tax=freshwater metagenome TaxID=449393 RepID=A0A6J6IYY9_9ZZZZ|nr:pyridoxamine 5-phosphate oxidase [Actinomycetota bacterium]